tara:strand:- start:49 stop:597 length:549 start_codon:yes stop_codon:yes gene_type:complete
MSNETATGASRWFSEGEYLCRVRRAPFFVSQQGKGNCVAIEVTITKTIVGYEAGRACWITGEILGASNTPGEVCSTVLLLERQQPAMANLKGFLLGASGLTEAQIIQMHADQHGLNVGDPATAAKAWEAFAEKCTEGAGEILAGEFVTARVQRIKKKNGDPFTRCVWEVPKADLVTEHAAPA